MDGAAGAGCGYQSTIKQPRTLAFGIQVSSGSCGVLVPAQPRGSSRDLGMYLHTTVKKKPTSAHTQSCIISASVRRNVCTYRYKFCVRTHSIPPYPGMTGPVGQLPPVLVKLRCPNNLFARTDAKRPLPERLRLIKIDTHEETWFAERGSWKSSSRARNVDVRR